MHLFSYLYIVVEHTLYQLIKVMKLKAYWLLQQLEIPSQCHTEIFLENVTTTIQGISGTIHGTGTTGCTIDLDTQSTSGSGIIFIGVIILGVIAYLLDRKLNLKQELELMDPGDQNQNQE